MSERERREAAPLVLLAAVVACVLVATRLPRWALLLAELAGRPGSVTLAVALVAFACALLTARAVATRRALARRARVALLPADSFDPTPEAVLRFASGLSRSRKAVRGAFQTRGSAVRIRIDHDERGQLRYGVELPAHARSALRTAAGAYGEVELRAALDVEPPGEAR
jgi:hypothetical protein